VTREQNLINLRYTDNSNHFKKMLKLIIDIEPYPNEIYTEINESVRSHILKLIGKLKSAWININDIPETGYRRMELQISDTEKIFVYEQSIVHITNNVSTLFWDSKKRINNYLLKIIPRDYYRKIAYFSEVRKCQNR
jgi:hypothetical protein